MVPAERKLLDVLSNNDVTFFIPPYQRNYEWTEDQCQVFLDDIVKTTKLNQANNIAEHFFGSITYFQTDTPFGEPDKLVLIDGQQRITTTMLLLVALRDIIDNKQVKHFIDSRLLKNNNVSDDSEYKIKLKQVETDWQAYKDIILKKDRTDIDKTANVYRNYRFFYNQLTLLKEQGINLQDLLEKGLQKFSIITIQLEPQQHAWENPQEIFESMNSLGKPLTLADLVRNYLLLGLDADTQEELYNEYWLHIEKTLPGNLSNYIRDFMQLWSKMSYKKATETNYKELYGIFKNIFHGLESKTILEFLSKYAEVYSWLLPNGRSGHDSVDYELADIQTLRVSTANSFLLGLLTKWKDKKAFTEEEIVDILDAFRIYCMRRRIISLTAGENKNFPLLVNYIDELINSDDKRQKMFEILAHQESNLRIPNDVELTRYLETSNFYNFNYGKFTLALIEERITKSRPDLSDKHLQVEHIMPQTLNDAWKKELRPNYESVHQDLVNTIGNLTLIRHNQELSNKPFEEKKDVYENKAGLQIAKTKITDQDHWNADAIQNRTKWIIRYLLEKVLPIPEEMRRTNNFSDKKHRGLSFMALQIIGEEIDFIDNPSITAKVISDKQVEFEGKKWRLSPLTREIQTRRGLVNQSGSYSGAQYWEYDGIKLADIIY